MGNVNSNCTQPLAMMAVARKLRLQRFQIIMMKESLASLSDGSGFVDRSSFDLSLARAKITQHEALEIFELLFTMWDHHGKQIVPAKKFAVGIAPLACSCDDLSSVLRFSLHINDEHKNGHVTPRDLVGMLISIDNTASYFGDAHLEPGDIDSVVEAVFDGRNIAIPYELCVRKLQSNAYIKRFASGKTRARVHFQSDVQSAGGVEDPVAPHNFAHSSTPRAMVAPIAATPSTPAERNVPTQHNEYSFEMLDENSENRQLYSPVKPKRSGSGLDESWASFVTEDTNNRDPPSTVFILTPNNHGGEKSPHARVLRDPPSFRQ